uniref:Uncharacterized protein n=1 Tax=Anguilla anguilla TaxID=7936 RepID=A0A0E9TAH3_ANGAN
METCGLSGCGPVTSYPLRGLEMRGTVSTTRSLLECSDSSDSLTDMEFRLRSLSSPPFWRFSRALHLY